MANLNTKLAESETPRCQAIVPILALTIFKDSLWMDTQLLQIAPTFTDRLNLVWQYASQITNILLDHKACFWMAFDDRAANDQWLAVSVIILFTNCFAGGAFPTVAVNMFWHKDMALLPFYDVYDVLQAHIWHILSQQWTQISQLFSTTMPEMTPQILLFPLLSVNTVHTYTINSKYKLNSTCRSFTW